MIEQLNAGLGKPRLNFEVVKTLVVIQLPVNDADALEGLDHPVCRVLVTVDFAQAVALEDLRDLRHHALKVDVGRARLRQPRQTSWTSMSFSWWTIERVKASRPPPLASTPAA